MFYRQILSTMSGQLRSKGNDPAKISSLARLPAKALSSTRIQQSVRVNLLPLVSITKIRFSDRSLLVNFALPMLISLYLAISCLLFIVFCKK